MSDARSTTANPTIRTSQHRLPPLTPLSLILELAIVIYVALGATSIWADPDPELQLPGTEAEWLTSHVHLAWLSLEENGFVPLWEPYLEQGEPLVDNPFSMLLNPISSIPTLLWGGMFGVRISVIWTAVLAAIGGWVFGRVLGFQWPGRVLLALLILGKGNMHAMIGTGYFQLGVSQAYFPWVFAGAIAILRTNKRRWPIVLTAVSFTLMFWAGNIWYTLPTLITLVLLTVTHTVHFNRRPGLGLIDWGPVRRMALAAFITLGLSAITFIPIFANRSRIGDHPPLITAGEQVDGFRVLQQYVDGSYELYQQRLAPGDRQFYYSFVVPLWFLVIITIGLPPIRPFLYRAAGPKMWQIWSVGLFMIVFTTIWGIGGTDLFIWIYRNIPFFGEWRFVGRALGVASFWIAILVAMRVDGLWRAVRAPMWFTWLARTLPGPAALLKSGTLVAIVAASGYAAIQVVNQWPEFARPGRSMGWYDSECVHWLRQQYPDRELSVWTLNYDTVTVYLNNHIRLANITADFTMLPNESTYLPHIRMREVLPEFGITYLPSIRSFYTEQGMTPVEEAPKIGGDVPCLWHNPVALPYAYSLPESVIAGLNQVPRPTDVTPVSFERRLDRIAMMVDGNPDDALVVTASESAYPGWNVWVDDKPAHLESVGGQIGVVIPQGTGQHYIYFQYIPPLLYFGAVITLLTWVFTVLFTLHAELLIPAPVRHRFQEWLVRVRMELRPSNERASTIVGRLARFMTDPTVLDADMRAESEYPMLPAGGPKQAENGGSESRPEQTRSARSERHEGIEIIDGEVLEPLDHATSGDQPDNVS